MLVDLDDEHTTCSICFNKFSCDINNTDPEIRKHLPVLSSSRRCDHWVCHGCVMKQQLIVAQKNNGRLPKWIQCMHCKENTSFNPAEPKYHRLLIDLLGRAQKHTAAQVKAEEHRVKIESEGHNVQFEYDSNGNHVVEDVKVKEEVKDNDQSEGRAAKLSLECLRSASAEVSEVRSNSSKMNNFDQLKALFASVNTAGKSNSKPCSIHIAGTEMTKDDFYINFDPEEFMEKHECLQPYFRNPNLHYQLLDFVILKNNDTTNSVMKGRPAAVFEEIRYTKPKSTKKKDGTVTITDYYYVLKCRDMFLWYSIIWTNEKYFKPTEPKPLEVLCKAYYLAVNEKVDNIMAPSWNDSKFESLPERVKDAVDINVLTDDDKNNCGRPGTGSVEAQINATSEMMYHMIITAEYTDNKQLIIQVVDKLSGEFGKDAEAQRVHLARTFALLACMTDKIYNILLCQLGTKHEEEMREHGGNRKSVPTRKGRNKNEMVEHLASTRMIFYALMEDWMKAYTEAGFYGEINESCLEIIAGSDLISDEMKSWIEKYHNGSDGKVMKRDVKTVISKMFQHNRFMKEAIGGQRFTKFCNSYPPSMLELIMMNQIRTLHKLKESYKTIKDQKGWPYEREEEKFSNEWVIGRKHLTVKAGVDKDGNKYYERPKSTMQVAPKTSINAVTKAGYVTMSDAAKIFTTAKLPPGVDADMLFHVVKDVKEEVQVKSKKRGQQVQSNTQGVNKKTKTDK